MYSSCLESDTFYEALNKSHPIRYCVYVARTGWDSLPSATNAPDSCMQIDV